MDWNALKRRSLEQLRRFRYPAAVALLGLLLMLLPGKKQATSAPPQLPVHQDRPPTLEQRLEEILSQVRGAGRVRVMITEKQGEEVIFQQNEDRTTGENTSSVRHDTVTLTGESRREEGLVRQVIPAVCQGAIVICEGADDPAVRLSVTQAVSRLTGLGTDRISVLKMK